MSTSEQPTLPDPPPAEFDDSAYVPPKLKTFPFPPPEDPPGPIEYDGSTYSTSVRIQRFIKRFGSEIHDLKLNKKDMDFIVMDMIIGFKRRYKENGLTQPAGNDETVDAKAQAVLKEQQELVEAWRRTLWLQTATEEDIKLEDLLRKLYTADISNDRPPLIKIPRPGEEWN